MGNQKIKNNAKCFDLIKIITIYANLKKNYNNNYMIILLAYNKNGSFSFKYYSGIDKSRFDLITQLSPLIVCQKTNVIRSRPINRF
jgi:hypothetical protein